MVDQDNLDFSDLAIALSWGASTGFCAYVDFCVSGIERERATASAQIHGFEWQTSQNDT